jgi:hypothetical protein
MNSLNRKKLSDATQLLQRYSQGERYREDIAERQQRQETFRELLNEPFSEFQFSQVVRQLWAAQLWHNRDYLISQILKANGIDKLRKEWDLLLSGTGSPGRRYEQFVTQIKHMGPSMVTEILCYHEPEAAGVWNSVARTSLGWLYDGDPLFRKYRLSGKEYDAFNELLRSVAEHLPAPDGDPRRNLLLLDYLLWEIQDLAVAEKSGKPTPPKPPVGEKSRHNELRDKVGEIGTGLGFDTDTEVDVAPGSTVDVVWRARIANLGSVAYVFEVQDKGSIDSLIVNLQQARSTLGARKLCVVSDREQIEKIQKRTETMPEELRRNSRTGRRLR